MFAFRKRAVCVANHLLKFTRNVQVSVIGASRPLGQSISLLLKQHPRIQRLTLCDDSKDTYGIALDVSHIPRESSVQGWTRMDYALNDSDVVIIASGEPKRANITESELFHQNANEVVKAVNAIAKHCPSAFIVVATDPLNQVLPLASTVLESKRCYNKQKLLGVTGQYTMRAQTCVAGMFQVQAQRIKLPVIGGQSPNTAVPLFSHITPWLEINASSVATLTQSVRSVDDTLAALKRGNGEATLSSAYATYCLVSAILNAVNGYTVEHTAYVDNNSYGTKFFTSPIIIQKHGIGAVGKFSHITQQEQDYLYQSAKQLQSDVEEGQSYLKNTMQKRKNEKKERNKNPKPNLEECI